MVFYGCYHERGVPFMLTQFMLNSILSNTISCNTELTNLSYLKITSPIHSPSSVCRLPSPCLTLTTISADKVGRSVHPKSKNPLPRSCCASILPPTAPVSMTNTSCLRPHGVCHHPPLLQHPRGPFPQWVTPLYGLLGVLP